MKKIIANAFLLISILHSPLDFATSVSKPVIENGWFVGAEAGIDWPRSAKNTTVPNGSLMPPPSDVDLYTIQQPGSAVAGSLYAGYRLSRASAFLSHTSLALRYQHLNSTTINGVIQQYSLPNFTNYNYSLKVASNVLSLNARVDLYQFKFLSPYISAGLGVANNKTSDYVEIPLSGIMPRISPAFQNGTSNHFLYNLGAGLDFQMSRKVWAAVGYEYANLGTVKTNGATGANWNGETLSLGKLTTNALLLSLFYQFSTL